MSNKDVYTLAACASVGVLLYVLMKMSRGKNLAFKFGYYLYTRTPLGYMYNQHKLTKARAELQGHGHSITQPITFGDLTIHIVPYGRDNYAYIVCDALDGSTVLIDPADPLAVQDVLKEKKLQPSVILTTHKHWDHSAGNSQLRRCYHSLVVYGGVLDRVPGSTHSVTDGENIECGRLRFKSYHTPGHTVGHVTYVLEGAPFSAPLCIFSGDHMFVGGIGKLFEGTPADMLESLDRIISLPDNSLLFPGHEYALSNLEFAASLEPDNKVVASKLSAVQTLREKHHCTSPTTLKAELSYNPFLRVSDPILVSCLGSQNVETSRSADAEEENRRVGVLAEFRRRKDVFKPSTPTTN